MKFGRHHDCDYCRFKLDNRKSCSGDPCKVCIPLNKLCTRNAPAFQKFNNRGFLHWRNLTINTGLIDDRSRIFLQDFYMEELEKWRQQKTNYEFPKVEEWIEKCPDEDVICTAHKQVAEYAAKFPEKVEFHSFDISALLAVAVMLEECELIDEEPFDAVIDSDELEEEEENEEIE